MFTAMCPELFGETIYSKGFWGADVMPSMGPRGSPGGGPRDEVTRTSEDLGL